MRPFDPLEVPLAGLCLLEASAGTGKTHAIASLYLRLLLEQGLEVPQVLVVTFTNAATEELRDRLRRRVREALAWVDGGGPDPFLEAVFRRLGRPEGLRQRLVDALARMDELAVFTIHAFCQRVLQEHAFESGALYGAELLTDETPLRRGVAEDFWRRRLYGAPAWEVEWVLADWQDPYALLRDAQGLVALDPGAVLPAVDAPAARAAVRAAFGAARTAWAAGREAIAALVSGNPALNARSYGPSQCAAALAAAEACFGREDPPPAVPDKLELLTPGRLGKATRQGAATPTHPFFTHCARFIEAHAPAREATRVAMLREAAQFLREQLAARKGEQRVLFFDDLLGDLDAALAGPIGERLAARLRAQYPVALIDEFQDTDPLQYRIFQRVYGGHPGHGLFLIGDPKQAIYGFRGADVFTYLQARRDAGAGEGMLGLATNWRSSTALVQAVNVLFGRVPQPFVLPGMDYHPVAASGRADAEPFRLDGGRPPALTFWFLGRPGGCGKVLGKDEVRPQVAAACAGAIVDLLEGGEAGRATLGERPLRSRDVAVLVRDRYEAQAIREALAAVGVASAYYSQESVFATEEAEDLARVLAAVADPTDAGRVRAALATRILGSTASVLAGLAGDGEAWEAVLERFRAYGLEWASRGLFPMLQRLIESEGVAGRLLAEPGGERRLTNLLQLAELLHGEARDHSGPEALLRALAERLEAADGRAEDEQLRLESDEDLVKVVTIHKSKGLEYPLVFVPFPWQSRPQPPGGPARYHDGAGGLRVDLSGTLEPTTRARADRERLAEDLRLLYVAVTRAKHRCWLTWGAVRGAEESALGYLLQGGPGAPAPLAELDDANLRRGLAALCAAAPDAVSVEDLPASTGRPWSGARRGAGALAARTPPGPVERGWRVASYSGLVTGREVDRPDHDALPVPALALALGGAPPADLLEFPRGARAGTCLHALLEALDFPAARGRVLEEASARALERHGYPAGWAPVLAAGVSRVLDTPLDASGRLRLRALGRERRRDELEFHYPLAALTAPALEGTLARLREGGVGSPRLTFSPVRGLMRGFIDLVFEWDGRYYLADYKSNHLGMRPDDYAAEALPAAMAEHRYDLQYLVYTVALHRYLGLRVPGYDYERDFGGVFYLFLRGMRPERGPACGVFFDRPQRGLVEALDRLFAGEGGPRA